MKISEWIQSQLHKRLLRDPHLSLAEHKAHILGELLDRLHPEGVPGWRTVQLGEENGLGPVAMSIHARTRRNIAGRDPLPGDMLREATPRDTIQAVIEFLEAAQVREVKRYEPSEEKFVAELPYYPHPLHVADVVRGAKRIWRVAPRARDIAAWLGMPEPLVEEVLVRAMQFAGPDVELRAGKILLAMLRYADDRGIDIETALRRAVKSASGE